MARSLAAAMLAAALLRSEAARYAKVVREAGIKAD